MSDPSPLVEITIRAGDVEHRYELTLTRDQQAYLAAILRPRPAKADGASRGALAAMHRTGTRAVFEIGLATYYPGDMLELPTDLARAVVRCVLKHNGQSPGYSLDPQHLRRLTDGE